MIETLKNTLLTNTLRTLMYIKGLENMGKQDVERGLLHG